MSDIEASGAVASPQQRATIDPARQEQARVFSRKRRWLGLIDTGLSGVLIVAAIAFDVAGRLSDALASAGLAPWQPIAGWEPWLVAIEALAFLLAVTIVGLPLSLYGYALSCRFDMARGGFGVWAMDRVKGFVLGGIFLAFVAEIVYLLLTTQPQTWWLWIAGGVVVFNVLLANLAPVLLVPLFFKQKPLAGGELRDRLMALAARAHTRVRGVYVMNLSSRTAAGNAAVMGLGNTRRIVLGDTILKDYTPDEIEIVMAHELGHQVHHDISKIIVFDAALNVAVLALVAAGLHAAVGISALHLSGINDIATLPVLALLIGISGFVTGPLSNTLSRIVERQADGYALDMLRDPDTFISAFRRLSNQNLAELDPNPVLEFLFYDHPAIGKRIRFAEDWRVAHARQDAAVVTQPVAGS